VQEKKKEKKGRTGTSR